MPELNPDGTVRIPSSHHQNSAAIAACTLCDADGYLDGFRVCDHVDHRPAAERGRRLVAAELAKIRERKGTNGMSDV